VSAARLAGTDPDTADSIVTLTLTQLRHAADAEARLIARALNHLAPNLLPPLTTLAAHHQPWIRCLATSLSNADSTGLSLSTSLLADDPDWRVRVISPGICLTNTTYSPRCVRTSTAKSARQPDGPRGCRPPTSRIQAPRERSATPVVVSGRDPLESLLVQQFRMHDLLPREDPQRPGGL
jgi:hypothetical protein